MIPYFTFSRAEDVELGATLKKNMIGFYIPGSGAMLLLTEWTGATVTYMNTPAGFFPITNVKSVVTMPSNMLVLYA